MLVAGFVALMGMIEDPNEEKGGKAEGTHTHTKKASRAGVTFVVGQQPSI